MAEKKCNEVWDLFLKALLPMLEVWEKLFNQFKKDWEQIGWTPNFDIEDKFDIKIKLDKEVK